MLDCRDLVSSHPSWRPSGKTRRGNVLQKLIKPLQKRKPRAANNEVEKRLPSSRGMKKREVLFVLRAPKGVTHPFPAAYGSMYGKKNITLISG